jgi:hypothetical protein
MCEKHTGISSLMCEDSTVSKTGPVGNSPLPGYEAIR